MRNTANEKPIRVRRVATATAATVRADSGPLPGLTASLGTISSLGANGGALVSVAGAAPVPALALTQISSDQLAMAHANGAHVLVVSLDGDPTRLVIIGVVGSPAYSSSARPTTAVVDGRRVHLTGQDEVVLTCGKASITLTKAGKVMIKGAYLSSEASGTNRIRGGSVQIN
jgi:Domain of unknown function (DUF6484)